jgi:hypothetical protein
MKQLAEQQRGLVVNQEDFEVARFLDLAAKREHLQTEISAVTEQPMTTKGYGDGSSSKTKSTPLPPELDEVISAIRAVDREIEEFLSERREALYLEIKSIRRGRNAMRGYRGKTQERPRFIDKEG